METDCIVLLIKYKGFIVIGEDWLYQINTMSQYINVFFTNEKTGPDVITLSFYPFEKYNGWVIKIAPCNFTRC